ncbi:MAG: response regulator [Proteobacteria bacterium]|nr:response regulator [Pseudomonadota bacterium]
MLQERLQTYLKNLLATPSQFQRLGLAWALCIINIALIILLGGGMMMLSGQREFLLVTLIMVGCAGGMIFFLLIKLERLNFTTKKQQIQAAAYENVLVPLLVLTPDFHFSYGNKKAEEECWWASSLLMLKNAVVSDESKAALTRLLDSISHKGEEVETLHLHREDKKELWRINTFPLGKQALWECHNMSHEKDEESTYLSQINTLTLLMDAATEGVFSLNEKGIFLFCNEKFAKWLGYERKEIVGSSFSKLLAKSRTQDSVKPFEIQGKCDFITASSRIKSAFLEQTQIPYNKGLITYSLVHLQAPFANQSDLRKVLDMSPLPVVCLDETELIQDSNVLFREQFWPKGTPLRGASFLDLVADFQKEDVKNALHAFLNGKDEGTPLEIYFKDARESIVSAYFAALPLKDQKGLFIQLHDITEQKRFESQLVQSQKMQAVGQLAGGIAHDFNNLLTAMIGFCDLLLLRHTPGDQSFTDVMQIKQNANRAANLVRQLLAFSRQQTLQPKVLDITECLAELSALLRRLIGSNIELKMKHARELGLVLVDQGQFEQVIINMAVNARDAMEGGGTISLTTQNYELKKAKRYGHDVIPPGTYVLVEIADTGVGIKPEIIDRIFDPFFSTKEVGSGTGLGLSTVYGIVKQTGGFIHVDSKVGEGTTFSIYLPRYASEDNKAPEPLTKEKAPPQDLTGSSTILLVEDEDAVRLFSARALRSKGYKVIEAINGSEALEFMKLNEEKIDLIISDVVMPQMDGPTFINEMNQLESNPKVLFISGYTEDTFQKQLKDNETKIHFLAKPFSLSDLAIRVKEILDEESPSLKSVG